MPSSIIQEKVQITVKPLFDWRLWRNWILANAVGEVVGLGAAALVGIWFAMNYDKNQTTFTILLTAILMILVGTFEGLVVGFAQACVLREVVEDFKTRAWIIATAIGAFIAWALGGIPSVAMSLKEQTTKTPPPEMSDAAMYGMAVLMGLALGFTLGVSQWMVLRRYVERAGWWTLANALAWAFGMPLVFLAAGNQPPENPFELAGWVIFALALVGAVVGAIHGLFLVWLLRGGKRDDHD
jgi:hypothetical protein